MPRYARLRASTLRRLDCALALTMPLDDKTPEEGDSLGPFSEKTPIMTETVVSPFRAFDKKFENSDLTNPTVASTENKLLSHCSSDSQVSSSTANQYSPLTSDSGFGSSFNGKGLESSRTGRSSDIGTDLHLEETPYQRCILKSITKLTHKKKQVHEVAKISLFF